MSKRVIIFTGWEDITNPLKVEAVENAIDKCISTQRSWAESKGYDYEKLTDDFFQIIPRDMTNRIMAFPQAHPGTLADYARLLWMKKYLEVDNYDVAVWFDADLVIYPSRFELDLDPTFSTLAEQWVTYVRDRDPRFKKGNSGLFANGLITCTKEGLGRLNHWIQYIEDAVRNKYLPSWYYFGAPYFQQHPLNERLGETYIPGLIAIRRNVAQLIVKEGQSAYDEFFKTVDAAWKERGHHASFANLSPNASIKFMDRFVNHVINYEPEPLE